MEIFINISETERECYNFTQFNFNFVLSSYKKEQKAKRTWNIVGNWSANNNKLNTCNEPQITDIIKEKLQDEIMKSIEIHSWSELKK